MVLISKKSKNRTSSQAKQNDIHKALHYFSPATLFAFQQLHFLILGFYLELKYFLCHENWMVLGRVKVAGSVEMPRILDKDDALNIGFLFGIEVFFMS